MVLKQKWFVNVCQRYIVGMILKTTKSLSEILKIAQSSKVCQKKHMIIVSILYIPFQKQKYVNESSVTELVNYFNLTKNFKYWVNE